MRSNLLYRSKSGLRLGATSRATSNNVANLICRGILFAFILLINLNGARAHTFDNFRVQFDKRVYRLTKFLDRGGLGEVYRAESLDADRRVIAVKVFENDPKVVAFVRNEFSVIYDGSQGATRFVHAEKIETHDFLPAGGGDAIQRRATSMELAHHQSLADVQGLRFVATDGESLNDEAIAASHLITRQLLQGSAHLKKYGLMHGDIKPDNIFFLGDLEREVTAETILKGIHRAVFGDVDSIAPQAYLPPGGYSAPELAEKNASITADEYSLALTIARVAGGIEHPGNSSPAEIERKVHAFCESILQKIDRLGKTNRNFALEEIAFLQSASLVDENERKGQLKELTKNSSIMGSEKGSPGTLRKSFIWIRDLIWKTCSLVGWRKPQ